jgi:hypothetical protein
MLWVVRLGATGVQPRRQRVPRFGVLLTAQFRQQTEQSVRLRNVVRAQTRCGIGGMPHPGCGHAVFARASLAPIRPAPRVARSEQEIPYRRLGPVGTPVAIEGDVTEKNQ